MTIAGYIYQADILCDECARVLGIKQAQAAGSSMSWGDCGTAEQTLGEWASLEGIQRLDESTFDSDDFPKVILSYQVEGCEICGECQICILHFYDGCPPKDEDDDDA
jgi:hypothetical protein